MPLTPRKNLPAARSCWPGFALVMSVVALFLVLALTGELQPFYWASSAICHQIPSHSFLFHNHSSPLCQRCTSIHSAFLTTFCLFLMTGTANWPRLSDRWLLAGCLLAIAFVGIDGLNSLGTLVGNGPRGFLGYTPLPALRIFSGTFSGYTAAVLLLCGLARMNLEAPSEKPLSSKGLPLISLVLVSAQALVLALRFPRLDLPFVIWSQAGVLIFLDCAAVWCLTALARLTGVRTGLRQRLMIQLAGLLLVIGFVTLIANSRSGWTV